MYVYLIGKQAVVAIINKRRQGDGHVQYIHVMERYMSRIRTYYAIER
jgi:hypothetical protein